MITKSRSNKSWAKIFVILIIQVSFLPRNCSAQFHWGKNYRLERKQLRDMFSQATLQNHVESNSMAANGVSSYELYFKMMYCITIYTRWNTLALITFYFNTLKHRMNPLLQTPWMRLQLLMRMEWNNLMI